MNVEKELNDANPMKEMVTDLAPIADAPIAPAHAIATVALNMAMKYHNMQMIPDGLTYQQYKMEGRNIREIGLVDVFETAQRIETWLLGSSDRIAKIVVDALESAMDDDEPNKEENSVAADRVSSS